MLIEMKQEIPQADYNRMLHDTAYMNEYIGWRAHFSGYPPAGYGCLNPRIFIEESQGLSPAYFCAWQRRDDCD